MEADHERDDGRRKEGGEWRVGRAPVVGQTAAMGAFGGPGEQTGGIGDLPEAALSGRVRKVQTRTACIVLYGIFHIIYQSQKTFKKR
jgi:hypothetical protein